MPNCGTPEACEGCSLPYYPDLGPGLYKKLGRIAEEMKSLPNYEAELFGVLWDAGIDIYGDSTGTMRDRLITAIERKRGSKPECV